METNSQPLPFLRGGKPKDLESIITKREGKTGEAHDFFVKGGLVYHKLHFNYNMQIKTLFSIVATFLISTCIFQFHFLH